MLSSFCHSHTTIDIVYLAESHFSLQLAEISNTGTLGVVFTPSTFPCTAEYGLVSVY